MRRLVALVLATTAMLAASIAAAAPESEMSSHEMSQDTATAATRADTVDGVAFAFAVNTPTSWIDGDAVAVSGYLGLTKQLGVRANVAAYDYTSHQAAFWLALASDGVETDYSGRIRDLSIGIQHFSRGLWDGFSLEVDALVRNADTKLDETFWNGRIRTRESTTYAARVMVGWSWLIQKRAFIALSVGFSTGLEKGEEQIYASDEFDGTVMHTRTEVLDRQAESLEGFFRFGLAFGRN